MAVDEIEGDDDLRALLSGGLGVVQVRRGKAVEPAREEAAVAIRPCGAAIVLPWGDGIDPNADPFRRAKAGSASKLCAVLAMRTALEARPDFLARADDGGRVSVIRVPTAAWGPEMARAWSLVVEAASTARRPILSDAIADAARRRAASAVRVSNDRKGNTEAQVIEAYAKSAKSQPNERRFEDAVAAGWPVHAISSEPEAYLSPEILLAEDARLDIPPINTDVIASLATALAHESGWPSPKVPKVPPTLTEAADKVTPLLVNLAHRPGQTPIAFLKRLASLVARSAATKSGRDRSTIRLEDLPGLGEAGEWGARAAVDLSAFAAGHLAWSELDRGVVLEGPPGCGKSSFAAALANTAGVTFISASLAQWQGAETGHLGTLLAAMRKTFEKARRDAPCVLLIDEIDSFPARSSVTHNFRDYVVEVVNGLLEQLDGAVDREGVLVVAACNDASNLDPALTRSGRLERVIRLSRPDVEGFVRMLRVHLAGALERADLAPVAIAAVQQEAVGADAERWCRGARRRARAENRPMVLADLVAEIGEPPPLYDDEALRRIAIHEAGHVIAIAAINRHLIGEVILGRRAGEGSSTNLDFDRLLRDRPHLTPDLAYKNLRVLLAGRAAEELVLGDGSGGAGGSEGSDLARATRIATMLAASTGLDDHPLSLIYRGGIRELEPEKLLVVDPHVRMRVGVILHRSLRAARELLVQHRDILERVADAILQRGGLSPQAALELVGELPPDPPDWIARLAVSPTGSEGTTS